MELQCAALQNICGTVRFPQDNGKEIISMAQINSTPLFGASDTSYRHSQSTRAWILSTGSVSDINSPLMSISGSGPVDGLGPFLSSSHGEL